MDESRNLSMNVHHIGYAILDLDKGINVFRMLGYSISETTMDISRKVAIVFAKNGNENVELIAPITEGSPISATLNKRGPSPYHICYVTKDIQGQIEKMRKNGWLVVQKPAPAPAIDDRRVAFLYNKDIGLIELVELAEDLENKQE